MGDFDYVSRSLDVRRVFVTLTLTGAMIALGLGAAEFSLSREHVGPSADGPLGTNAPDLGTNSVPIRRSFSYGMAIVYNHSSSRMTLRSVRLVDATPGMKLVKAFALGPHRYQGDHRINLWSGDDGWPSALRNPPRPLRPLRGHPVPRQGRPEARWGTELYLKLRVAHAGRFQFRHLRVRYRVRDHPYVAVIEHPFRSCGRPDPDQICPIAGL